MNPFLLEEHSSLLDFQHYYNEVVRIHKEDEEHFKTQGHFVKSLVAIRNILNNMKLPEHN